MIVRLEKGKLYAGNVKGADAADARGALTSVGFSEIRTSPVGRVDATTLMFAFQARYTAETRDQEAEAFTAVREIAKFSIVKNTTPTGLFIAVGAAALGAVLFLGRK